MNKYGLNDEQWGTITDPARALLCFASAGAGKTRTLVTRIIYLMDSGNNPKSILSVTFTNKAANEIKDRIKAFSPSIDDMQISTIHSMSVRIIRAFAQHTPLKVPFSIYDDSDQLSLIKTILKARGLKNDPYELLNQISLAKSKDSIIEDQKVEDLKKIYQDILIKNNAADFDDLLIYARNCLKEDDCKSHYSNLWKHILVDESQDTSKIQHEILTSIYDPSISKSILYVGDTNQSIYSWRGANPENIESFKQKYNPSIHYLTYNYRSSPEIIRHANVHLQFGKPMVAKSSTKGSVTMSVFANQEEEASRIAEAIFKINDYENTAILYRMNSRSLLFEKHLATRRIPYKVLGDMPYYKRRVAKDLLSYCKAATNNSDIESLVRIVNVPKRGFGETKQEKLYLEGWPYLHQVATEAPEIDEFINLLQDIRHKSPSEAINEVLQKTGYRNTLTKDTDLDMLDSFLDVVSGFKTIEELVLTSTFLEKDAGHGVKLMSAHASKGLEFDNVFVVGVESGVWPHQLSENIPEEERLYYVAISRPKKFLNVSCSKSRLFRGQSMPTSPSSLFLKSYNFLYKAI